VSVAIITAAWGRYWAEFGDQFQASTAALQPAAAQVIVASPEQLYVAPHVTNVRSSINMWDSFSDAASHVTADWIWAVGVDDTYPVDALADLPEDCDVISVAAQRADGAPWAANPNGFVKMLGVSYNPMLGSCIVRRHVWGMVPWRRVVWPDWMQWLEIHKLGLSVRFDKRPRYFFTRHEGAHSMNPSVQGQAEIDHMRGILQNHDVVPGVMFPPELVD
jgi:hypothetical protein